MLGPLILMGLFVLQLYQFDCTVSFFASASPTALGPPPPPPAHVIHHSASSVVNDANPNPNPNDANTPPQRVVPSVSQEQQQRLSPDSSYLNANPDPSDSDSSSIVTDTNTQQLTNSGEIAWSETETLCDPRPLCQVCECADAPVQMSVTCTDAIPCEWLGSEEKENEIESTDTIIFGNITLGAAGDESSASRTRRNSAWSGNPGLTRIRAYAFRGVRTGNL